MDICPYCGKKLSEDEKIIYKCTSCGKRLEPTVLNQNRRYINEIARAVKTGGIVIIVLGTTLSFIVAGGSGAKYEFSLLLFLIAECISIISGFLLIGFSEIIQLLEDIKNKLK